MTKKNTAEELNKVVGEFVGLANQLKDKGHDINLISAAMMSASGVYTTYTVAGDKGYLQDTGVDKVVQQYKQSLEWIQNVKKAAAEADQNQQGE